MPYFSCRPKLFQNSSYFSRSLFSMDWSSEAIFFSSRPAMSFSCRSCCSISREMFRLRSWESTRPRTKLKQSGSRSGHFSMMSTPLA